MRLAAALLATLILAPVAGASPAKVGYPVSMAALGDSITRAFDAGRIPFREAPSESWATGSDGSVQSLYTRVLRQQPAVRGHNANLARLGARARDLPAQAARAVALRPDLVTILVGANDVCASSLHAMTPLAEVRASVATSLGTLTAGLPDSRIEVLSVPDLSLLWSLYKGSRLARLMWKELSFCPVLLDRPTASGPADQSRRQQVRERTVAVNRTLADVCAGFVHCRFDGNAVFKTAFARSDVSHVDYFHPSAQGQRKLADRAWAGGFDFADRVPPASTASVAPGTPSKVVTLTARDDAGVAGVEYRIGSAQWVRYVFPVALPPGERLVYRAVDVNGNVEASHTVIG